MARTVSAGSKPAVILKTRAAAIAALDQQTRALVGKPHEQAFRMLDAGELRGTLAEVHLKVLRALTA